MFLRRDEGGRAYGCCVGIEIWAVIALITVLSVYLLPLLVGRREMARRSNVQDRYSAELRVLATGTAAVERDETCASSGHAELFRRRPEVRVMNRPAVRNVRALRTERELDRARQVHAQGRERRRVAASHRGIVASVLLGVSLGAWVLGLLTALPWWPALLPTALLGTSMVAGRRAALASAAADRRERRRIAALEQTLVTLTGRRSSASVVAAPRSVVDSTRSASSGAGSAVSAVSASEASPAVSAESVESTGDSGTQDSFMERLAREGDQRSAVRSASSPRETAATESAESAVPAEATTDSPAEATGTAAVRPSRTIDSEEERLAKLDADLDAETAAAVAAEREATRRASVYVPSRHAGRVSRDMGMREAVSRDGDEESSPRTKDFVASLSTSTSRSLSGWGKLFAEASAIEQEAQERDAAASTPEAAAPARPAAAASPQPASEPARPVSRPQAPAAAPAEAEGVSKEEATTSTPPQGWRPVHVPAPTYTLAARAPRRSYADPEVDPGTSAPVPARPQTARAYVPAPVEDDEEELFHPIDLDAILEGRRAAGE